MERDAREQSQRCQLRERVKLRHAGIAVGNAGVFMNIFQRGKKPQTILHDRAAERADIILARKWLLRVGRWIVDREARIQSGSAFVKALRHAIDWCRCAW